MIFTQEQVQEILSILDYHSLFVISTNFGTKALSEDDKNILRTFGVDIDKISKEMPLYERMFLFGRLSGILSDEQTKDIDYNNFLKFINSGQYIPLNKRERFELEIAERKTYTHLKGLREKAKQELESTIIGEEQASRQAYETAISEEVQSGVKNRKSIQKIVSDLGHRVETWQHDWNRIIQTEMQGIYNNGRLRVIEEVFGQDAKVWKQVYSGACRHCIRLHLTKGLGSKPILKTVKELINNGTNIGRKVNDWKFTIDPEHPFCRCEIKHANKGYIWSDEKQSFIMPKEIDRKIERKSKIKIIVGEKEFYV